jgi:hypothetical protein
MKDLIKRSDCNHCANKNCPPHVSGRVGYDCKTFKPVEQGLANPFRIAFFNNFEGFVDNFQKAGLQIPKEVK